MNEARQVEARSRLKLLMKQVNFLAAINSSNSANALWAVLIVAAAHAHYFLQICDVSRVIRCTRPSSPLTFNYHFFLPHYIRRGGEGGLGTRLAIICCSYGVQKSLIDFKSLFENYQVDGIWKIKIRCLSP